ncbi:MAG: hypothetical protein IT285_00200 [Bdellovibrionales bacterium]|nr:hypothetical protein [Bdellovibrionales bacterium]
MRAYALGIALVSALWTSAASGENPRFTIDPRVNIAALAGQLGEPTIRSSYSQGRFDADASAVIIADFARLRRAAFDFDRYVAMSMPYLHGSHTVGSAGGGIAHIWNWMSMALGPFNQTTKHCFLVHFHPSISSYSSGSEWQIDPCPSGAQARLPQHLQPEFEDDPAFDRLDGIWYMEALPALSENGAPKIYVRYATVAEPDVPGVGLVAGAIRSRMESGAKRVIGILAREAALQP